MKVKLNISRPIGIIEYIVKRANGTVEQFKKINTLTDVAFSTLFDNDNTVTFSNVFSHISVGVGSEVITSATDVLVSQYGARYTGVKSTGETQIGPDMYETYTVTHQYQIGDIVNQTITNICMFSAATGNNMTAGALLDNGIYVDQDDQLTINYTIAVKRIALPLELSIGSVNVGNGPVNYSIQLRSEFFYKSSTDMAYLTPRVASNYLYVNDSPLNTSHFSQSVSRVHDAVQGQTVYTFDILIRPSAGDLNISKIGFAPSIVVPGNVSQNRKLDMVLASPIEKLSTKKLPMTATLTVSWS